MAESGDQMGTTTGQSPSKIPKTCQMSWNDFAKESRGDRAERRSKSGRILAAISPFHGGNGGSNPPGDVWNIKPFQLLPHTNGRTNAIDGRTTISCQTRRPRLTGVFQQSARSLINSMVPSGSKCTLRRLPCCHLAVAHCRMTTAVKLVFQQSFVAGSPALRCSLMGDGMFHRRAFTPESSAALRAERGAQLLLERLGLAAMQAPPVPTLGVGALCGAPTRITGYSPETAPSSLGL
jgi:hypothetical protein